jgi:hypothetical protein
MARGAVALERLEEAAHRDLGYTFTTSWSDGTTGITLSPLELLEKLAALVPLPRVHLVRFGGCFAPHSPLRGAITLPPRQRGGGRGDDRVASLELGAAPEAGVCPGSGHLSSATVWAEGSAARCAVTEAPALRPSVVPSGSAADYRRHHPG